jgi:2-polyprenyl-3-methyl-5-hydroxy-6-metoxy-1,4-benzoquinol methylase
MTLDLGIQPLANSYLNNVNEDEEQFPLAVNLCRSCYHLQLTHTVDPSTIYKNYLYVTGTTKTMKVYSEWFADYVVNKMTKKHTNVLDIGCNDGTQLDSFKSRGLNTFGVDPAENIYPTSSAKHDVICDFFGPAIVEKFKYEFDAITAQNVFAHNPNPLEFLQVCKKLMSDHTLLFIQTSQADMVLNNEFDTVYHEHINFFNINSMNELAKRAGLYLIDTIKTPIHGNSYLFILSTKDSSSLIQDKIKAEEILLDIKTYAIWENNIKSNMNELKRTLESYKFNGYKIIGYGAAAKGNTLLNFINMKLDLIIDDNPLKHNLYTPRTKILIKGPDSIKEFNTNDRIMFMPLAWNFFTEISKRIKTVRNNKQDVFLKYFPKVEICQN